MSFALAQKLTVAHLEPAFQASSPKTSKAALATGRPFFDQAWVKVSRGPPRRDQALPAPRTNLAHLSFAKFLCCPVAASLEPDPKVIEQYQPFVIHPSLRRDGVKHGMDWYCPA